MDHLQALGIDQAFDEGLTQRLNCVTLDSQGSVSGLIRSDQGEKDGSKLKLWFSEGDHHGS